MSEIQRYRLVVERERGQIVKAYEAPWYGSLSPEADYVRFSDHLVDKAAAVAQAVRDERERCRREEVEPALVAAQALLEGIREKLVWQNSVDAVRSIQAQNPVEHSK